MRVFSYVYQNIAFVPIINAKMNIESISKKILFQFDQFLILKWAFGIYHSNTFVIKQIPIVKMVHYP